MFTGTLPPAHSTFPNSATITVQTNGGAELNTDITQLIDLVSKIYVVPVEIAEDMVQETQSVRVAFLAGERDDYDDLAEIVYDYLSLDSHAIQILLEDIEKLLLSGADIIPKNR